MKKILTLVVSAVAATAVYGQGYFDFNNLSGAGNIKISSTQPIAAGEGTAGQFVGSTYSVTLFYSLTSITQPTAPSSLTQVLAGATGAGPGPSVGTFYGSGNSEATQANGAGFFQGPSTATIPSTGDGTVIYVEAAVWFTSAGSYANATTTGKNAGYSAPIAIRLATGSDLTIADLSGLSPFTVQVAPEPATIALGGLGAAALLLFRRRK